MGMDGRASFSPHQRGQSRQAANNLPQTSAKLAAHFEHVETVDLLQESDDSLSNITVSTKSTTNVHAASIARYRQRDNATAADGLSDTSFLSRQVSPAPDSPGATIPVLSVLDVIPSSFDDMYSPEVLLLFPPQLLHHYHQHQSQSASSGSHSNYSFGEGLFSSFGIADLYLRRPSFTRRDLIDWEKNDLRSLCIVTELKPEWLPAEPTPTPTASNLQSPTQIIPPLREEHFRIIVLPLYADDETIVYTLAGSDLYVEFGFSMNHRVRLARETINICLRHRRDKTVLTKPEWRRVIDNYLLALGCEAQGRVEFKKAITIRALRKQEQQLAKRTGNLLKRVLLNRASSSAGLLPSRTSMSSSGRDTGITAMTKMTPPSLLAGLPSSSTGLQAATSFLSRTTKSTTEFFQNLGPKVLTSASSETVPESSSIQPNPRQPTMPGLSSSVTSPPVNPSVLVSRAEQKVIWREVQIRLYTRLGLDWEPTELAI
ncbi:hypothetical protein V1520DRAFT_15788 [Lipomyces starkeyi]|uniref:Uncharacterized protein n=1 Tax=Lipomyces starkeyi NRRL Y-11557 TaxID=675824 RepID=A0A1E3Q884_LIPST|nr:hypothetical protein LIPSTDRAFT_3131 [Lipomyces starkeyi NRRL Y-11557]